MKSISIVLKNLRNLLPYFLLIAIYFFFVNLEARRDKDNVRYKDKENILPNNNSSDDNKTRISIPIIPYKQ